MLTYAVLLLSDADGGYSVEVPALLGCVTQGETKEEALSTAKEAIEVYLESLRADGEPIPTEPNLETAVVEVAVPDHLPTQGLS